MSDLPDKEPKRAPQDTSPMTTLTLTAGLNDAQERADSQPAEPMRAGMASAQTPVDEVPVSQLVDQGLLAATRTGAVWALRELVRR